MKKLTGAYTHAHGDRYRVLHLVVIEVHENNDSVHNLADIRHCLNILFMILYITQECISVHSQIQCFKGI